MLTYVELLEALIKQFDLVHIKRDLVRLSDKWENMQRHDS